MEVQRSMFWKGSGDNKRAGQDVEVETVERGILNLCSVTIG